MSYSIVPSNSTSTSPTSATSPHHLLVAAALADARRVAAESAVLIAEAPLRRSLDGIATWRRTSDLEQVVLRCLQDLDLDALRRRLLLGSRRAELEQAQAWSQHVVLNKQRAAKPLDAEDEARACGAAILMFARLARSTGDRVTQQVAERARALIEGHIVPLTPLERFSAEMIVDGCSGADARDITRLLDAR